MFGGVAMQPHAFWVVLTDKSLSADGRYRAAAFAVITDEVQQRERRGNGIVIGDNK
jgi:hypothetical protein